MHLPFLCSLNKVGSQDGFGKILGNFGDRSSIYVFLRSY
ncbi:hypothetical protein CKA32_003806 [Geitlerinema sp. FC II]|nr:hypothetical protein CKA32_003806 [Geitlerinema sp. FC II]